MPRSGRHPFNNLQNYSDRIRPSQGQATENHLHNVKEKDKDGAAEGSE
jgi:hypothetical protein